MRTRRAGLAGAVVGISAALVLAGCGATGSTAPSPASNEVSLALDWTPNTNHTGFYVATALGYYREAGIDLTILPYSDTSPDTLVSAGKADFGISFQDAFSFGKAAGLDIVSVAAILQHTATEIVVRADSTITRPRDLDGLTYAGFGGPAEVPTMRKVIRDDGGTGEFRDVTLNTFAYDAVYSAKADFAQAFATWEVLDAQLRGKPLRTFPLTDYGLPDRYDVLMISSDAYLSAYADAAGRFVRATVKGFAFAAANPEQAAQILIDANPGAFNEPELVRRSAKVLATDFYLDEEGRFGTQTESQWRGYSDFLFDAGLLVDESGAALTEAPDVSGWYTERYLDAP